MIDLIIILLVLALGALFVLYFVIGSLIEYLNEKVHQIYRVITGEQRRETERLQRETERGKEREQQALAKAEAERRLYAEKGDQREIRATRNLQRARECAQKPKLRGLLLSPTQDALHTLGKSFVKAIAECHLATKLARSKFGVASEFSDSDFFLIDILKVMVSVAFSAEGFQKTHEELFEIILNSIRATHTGVFTLDIAKTTARDTAPSPLYVPVIVLFLKEHDDGYDTSYAATTAELFVRLVKLIGEATEASSSGGTKTAAYTQKYVDALNAFLPQGKVDSSSAHGKLTKTQGRPTGLDAVAGMTELKQQLREEVVEVFRNPARFKKYGIAIPNGVLLFGPPGCGKTYIARQLAAELGYSFFEISPSDIGSSYMHGTILKIRETFEQAARKAPSVLFIDEFEALVPSRATIGDSHQYKAEEVNEFLTRMSGCSERRILLIAATNQPWDIDPAVQRSGRLDKKIYVAPPDLNARSEMLTHHLSGRYISPDLKVDSVASQLSGYSSSDLKLLVDEAAKLAFKSDEAIGEKHLAAARGIVSPSVSSEDEERYQQFGTMKTARAVSKLGFHN